MQKQKKFQVIYEFNPSLDKQRGLNSTFDFLFQRVKEMESIRYGKQIKTF